LKQSLNFLREELQELKYEGLYREFNTVCSGPEEWVSVNGRKLFNLCSNNYLGLAADRRVKQAASNAVEVYGCGATASRLIVGNYELYDRLEEKIARFKGTESALVFNSGYCANIGIISALVGRGDAVISDRLNHASIIDGIILSRAENRRYRHLDLDSLEHVLKDCASFRRKLIVTDTVFSMDGDVAPLKEIVWLKEKYGALLMIDEAHGSGVLGPTGKGLAEVDGVSGAVEVNMGTLGKALGVAGAYVAGSQVLIDYLRNKSRSLIYSTGLPPAVVGGLLAALQIIQEEPWRRERLLSKAEMFRHRLNTIGFKTMNSQSQIIPIVVGSASKAVEFSKRLMEENVLLTAIRPPTVPTNTARLRVSLMSTHQDKDLEMALAKIEHVGRWLDDLF